MLQVDYHLARGGMLFHCVVEVNCKRGATTENQHAPSIWAKGCVLDDGKKVKSSMARSLPVENLLPQNVGSIINYLQ